MSDWPALAALAAAGASAAFAAAGLGALRRARRSQAADLAALRSDIDAALSRGARDETAEDGDGSRSDALSAIAEALRDDLDHMFMYVSRLSDTVRGEISPLADRLDALETRLSRDADDDGRAAVAELTTRVEAASDAQTARLDALASALTAAVERVEEVAVGVAGLDARIAHEADETRRRETEARGREDVARAAAASAFEDLETRLTERMERLDRGLTRASKAAAGAEARLGERLSALAGSSEGGVVAAVEALGARLDAAVSQDAMRRAVADALGETSGATDALADRLAGVETRLEALADAARTADGDARLAAMAAEIGRLAETGATLSERIETLGARPGIDAITATLDALTVETAAARAAAEAAAALRPSEGAGPDAVAVSGLPIAQEGPTLAASGAGADDGGAAASHRLDGSDDVLRPVTMGEDFARDAAAAAGSECDASQADAPLPWTLADPADGAEPGEARADDAPLPPEATSAEVEHEPVTAIGSSTCAGAADVDLLEIAPLVEADTTSASRSGPGVAASVGPAPAEPKAPSPSLAIPSRPSVRPSTAARRAGRVVDLA